MVKKIVKEKVVLAEIYREDERLKIDLSKSANTFELLGFLRCYVKTLEMDLIDSFEFGEDFNLY